MKSMKITTKMSENLLCLNNGDNFTVWALRANVSYCGIQNSAKFFEQHGIITIERIKKSVNILLTVKGNELIKLLSKTKKLLEE